MASLKEILRPPIFADEDDARVAAQLNALLLLTSGLLALLTLYMLYENDLRFQANTIILGSLGLLMVGLLILLRLRYIRLASYSFLIISWASLTYLAWIAEGIRDSAYLASFVIIMAASLLVGWRAAALFTGLSILTGWFLVYGESNNLIVPEADSVSAQARELTAIFILVGLLIYFIITNFQRSLKQARQSNLELAALSAELENRVTARTQDLAISAEVSRSLSTILDRDQLVDEVVQQVRDAFDYYHVQIYLLDEATQQLHMVGGTGQAGKTLLAAGHKLALGQGLVGQAAKTGTAVLVPDVTQAPYWLPNPLLPETRSEVAVPILLGDQVLGVLDVQHNLPNGLNQDNADLLQSITGQVAIALQNARQLQATRQSQERFALIIAGTNDGIWDWDISTGQVYFSPRWKEMIGYTDEEISNDFAAFEALIHPDDHDFVMQQLDDYLHGRIPAFEFEYRLRHKDGSYRWILVRATLVRDAQGAPLRLAGSHTDITARKQSEERRRESEALLRTIIDSSPDWITVKDQDHRFRLVNRAFANSFNFEPEFMLGKDDLEIGFPAEIVLGNPEKGIRGFWADDDEVLASGQLKVIPEEPGTVQGQPRVLNTIKVPLRNSQGEVNRLVAFVRDITSIKQAEETIRQEQARTQAILQSVTTPLLITRLSDGGLLYANTLVAEMVGIPLADLEGWRSLNFYANPADRQAIIHKLQTEGQVNNYEVRLRRANDEHFWGLISSRVFEFQGEPAVVTSIIDITTRREAEAALALRARELQTVAQVGTAAATVLEPERLLQEVVDLTKERFELYHAHIYLLDPAENKLRLHTGAGEIGRSMVAEGRQINLSQEQSLVARAARNRQGVLVNDVQAETGFLPHPLLPETRAEMAVPLIAGSQVLGVLDVQSAQAGRFTKEEVSIFTTLAAQIAVALQNARRYDEAQRALDELTRMQRLLVREGWQAFLLAQERPYLGFHFDQQNIQPILREETAVSTSPALTVPLTIRGETIGQIGLRNPSGEPISPEKGRLLQTMSQQVSEALERARLSEQTQLALTEAETLSQLSARLNAAQTYQQINNAVTEIMKARTNDTIIGVLFEITSDAQNRPEWMVLMTTNDQTGVTDQYQRFPVTMLNAEPAWVSSGGSPVLIANTQTDERLNANERALYQQTNTPSIAFLPLRLGSRWLGLFSLAWGQPVFFTPADERLLTAMVDQLALAVNSLQLLDSAQKRARREQLLREVSARVTAAVDAQTVLQTATREIGRALGLDTFVYLKKPQTLADNQREVEADIPLTLVSEPDTPNLAGNGASVSKGEHSSE